MEYERKNSSLGVIILVIIFAIAAFAGGYYISDSNMLGKKEQKKTSEAKTEEIKEEKVSEEDIKTIINRIESINNIADLFPIKDVSEIPNQKLLGIGMPAIYASDVAHSFSQTNVEQEIYFIFGDNVKITHENYLCKDDKIPLYKYDATSKMYVTNTEHPGHGTSGLETYKFFISATSKDNILEVNYKNMYIPTSDITPVANIYDAPKNGNKVLENVNWDEVESKYETIKDKLPITTYTFEKTKFDGYNLKSVIIKEK